MQNVSPLASELREEFEFDRLSTFMIYGTLTLTIVIFLTHNCLLHSGDKKIHQLIIISIFKASMELKESSNPQHGLGTNSKMKTIHLVLFYVILLVIGHFYS